MGVALAAWRWVDFGQLKDALLATSPQAVALLLGLLLLDRTLMAVKWWQLLRAGGVDVSLPSTWVVYYQAAFLNRVIPTSLGADVFRGVRVVQLGGAKSVVVASMLVEKVIGVLGASLLATAGAIVIAPTLSTRTALLLGLIPPAVGLGVLALFALSLSNHGARAASLLPGEKLKEKGRRLHEAHAVYRTRKAALVLHFLLTVVEQATQFAMVFVCARALDVATPWQTLLAVIAVSELLRKFAMIAEGWGLAEFMRVLVFTAAGIDPSTGAAIALLYHAAAWLVAAPGGLLLLRPAPGGTT